MRVVLACVACAAGCGFQTSSAVLDASDGKDSTVMPDAPIDGGGAPDVGPATRTRVGLIGLWELNEIAGTTVADTSDATLKVPLLVGPGTATFVLGTMTTSDGTVVESTPKPHLNQDVIDAQAVTLEAWVTPSVADQGSLTAPVVVAGLSSSINARNVSLMQAGKRWLARVRTTADLNGGPDLLSTVDVTPGMLTHLVVVADATQRALYIDGIRVATDPAPGAPSQWDRDYRMEIGNEHAGYRHWKGTFALVALYKAALTQALVTTNFQAGANP